jgi:hypothetical protein
MDEGRQCFELQPFGDNCTEARLNGVILTNERETLYERFYGVWRGGRRGVTSKLRSAGHRNRAVGLRLLQFLSDHLRRLLHFCGVLQLLRPLIDVFAQPIQELRLANNEFRLCDAIAACAL